MPIYEYQCSDCQSRLEKIQRFKDKPLQHCPDCGSENFKKILSPFAFHLKGTGWYETDFKNNPSISDKKDLPTKQKSTEAKTSSQKDDK